MPRNQGQPEPFAINPRESFGLLTRFADIGSMCYLPLTRKGMGRMGVGWEGLLSLLGMMMYCRSRAMELYITVWLVMAAWHRLFAFDRRQLSGFLGHVRFLSRLDWRTARILEIFAVWGIGKLVAAPDLGRFLCFGVYPLTLRYVIDVLYIKRRAVAAADAQLQMELMRQEMEEGRRLIG